MNLKKFQERFSVRSSDALLLMLMLLLFTIASTVSINPYHYGTSDNSITIPFVKAFANGSLYPNDYLLSQRAYYYTYLWDAVGFLMEVFHIGLPYLFFGFYFIAVYMTFAGAYLICMTLFGRREVAFLSLFFLLFAQESLGYAFTIDSMFITRGAALPFLLFSIYNYFNKRYTLSFFLLGLAYLIHPLTTHFVIFMILVASIVEIRSIGVRRFLLCIGVLIVTASPILIWAFLSSPPELKMFRSDPEWVNLLRLRSAHHIFPFSWDLRLFLQGAMELFAFVVAWKYSRDTKPEYHRIVKVFVGVIIAMCIIGTVFSELWAVSSVLVLQFLRGFQFFKYFAMMYVANHVVREVQSREDSSHAMIAAMISFGLLFGATFWKSAWVAVVALLGLLIFYRGRTRREPAPVRSILALAVVVTLLSGREFVKRELSPEGEHFSLDNAQDRDWLDVQKWAKNHTAPQDYFIVPPTIQGGFRVESDRPVFGDWEDGGLMNGNPAFGHEWFRRMTELGYGGRHTFEDSFKTNTEKDFVKIAKEITLSQHKTYLVEYADGNKLNFPISYENPKYWVYDVYRRNYP